jgi:hypothetical protein
MENILQQYFDKTCAHLFKQGQPARIDMYSTCQYRMINGLRCAVGCHIPDNEYSPKMEGETIRTLKEKNMLPPSLAKDIAANEMLFDLLKALQLVHDEFSNWGHVYYLQQNLARVAETFGLTSTAAYGEFGQ